MLLFILLFFTLLLSAYFIARYTSIAGYIKANKELKEENWSLIQDNRQLEQLVDVCVKELKECRKNYIEEYFQENN